MSLHHNPRIVTDGLVFAYDMDNAAKSWKGRPLTNSYNDIFTSQSMRTHTKHYWNGKKWIINSTYTHPGYPGPKGVFLGKVAKHVSGAFNSSWSGNSYGYMLRDISGQTNGEYYTQSCWVYVSQDSNITAIPSVIEGESSGETSAFSGEPTQYDMNNKGTWQRIAKRAISDGTVRYIPVYPRRNGVTDGSFTGAMLWGGAQVEDGSNVSQLVDAGDGVATRSNTQALLDMSKSKNTVTASSLTYNSDGTFEFDNLSSNYVDLPNDIGITGNNVSAFAWFKRNGSPSGGYHIICGGQELEISIPDPNGAIRVGVYSGGTRYVSNHGSGLLDGNWHHIGFTSDGTTKTAYIDGESVGTQSISGTLSSSFSNRRLGRFGSNSAYYANANISIYQIYNRALTAAEIKQNFNATRGRFGI